MTLTIDIHIGSCTHLDNCIYQLWCHRLQYFLKYPLFYLFPIQKHKGQNWTLLYSKSRSTQGHNLNKLGSTRAPNAPYQVSRSSAFWFRRRRFFKVFTIYGHGGHLGHVTCTSWTNFDSPIPRRLQMKFGFNQPSDFRGDVYILHIHTHGRQRPTYTISSPMSLKAQVS